MKVLFCNIAYMNHYTGNIEADIPKGGGAWVEQHKDAHEKWNFLNVNGECFGFVQNRNDQFHIERLEGVSTGDESTENAIVVWCARKKDDGETVIVGWYENATIYRYYCQSPGTPFGLDRFYFAKANADDCYLLPEDERTYAIGRASKDGTGKGFGQNNFWYADSEYAQQNIVPNVLAYLQSKKSARINTTNADFLEPKNGSEPLSEEEVQIADDLYNEGEYAKYIPFGYRSFRQNPTGDNAFFIAISMRELHQYSKALEWYRKAIEIEGESWDTVSALPYLMAECGLHEEALEASMHLLTFAETEDSNVRHEIYSMLADNSYALYRMDEAISWLDKILEESKDEPLIKHTKETRTFFVSRKENLANN